MTAWQILGALILALPFVGIFVFSGLKTGWWETTLVFVLTFALIAAFALGVALVKGAIP